MGDVIAVVLLVLAGVAVLLVSLKRRPQSDSEGASPPRPPMFEAGDGIDASLFESDPSHPHGSEHADHGATHHGHGFDGGSHHGGDSSGGHFGGGHH